VDARNWTEWPANSERLSMDRSMLCLVFLMQLGQLHISSLVHHEQHEMRMRGFDVCGIIIEWREQSCNGLTARLSDRRRRATSRTHVIGRLRKPHCHPRPAPPFAKHSHSFAVHSGVYLILRSRAPGAFEHRGSSIISAKF
jgi:hypothetical protein